MNLHDIFAGSYSSVSYQHAKVRWNYFKYNAHYGIVRSSP